jgi:DNA end-binding protein Ku
MAAQGIWNGTISFSLVAIPVRLVTAVEPGHISFHLLHSKDYSRLTRKMYCPADGKLVPPDEIIRGYEILPGKYIPMTDEELESVSPERSRTIEIIEFININDVDPIYFDRPYYIVPSKGGEKAYQLLVEIMDRTKKAGLAKFVLAEREYLVAVTSKDGALALTTLHYNEDILPEGELSPKKGPVDADEEERMKKNITGMIADFDPGKYADGRRNKISALLDAKMKEKALVEAPSIADEEGEGPADLVAALEQSMRKVKESR